MATLKEIVLKHQLRADKTWNVKIRVTHNRQSAYISTEHYIGKGQLSKDCTKIKDNFILSQLGILLALLRLEISKLGSDLHRHTAKTLAEYLSNTRVLGSNSRIDFFTVSNELVEQLKKENRVSTASNYSSATNNLKLWLKGDTLDFKDITVRFLKEYEQHLKGRENIGSRGLESNLASLRAIFNYARDKHNDEDLNIIKIPHYPFTKYKIPKSIAPKQRSLSIETIRKIRDYIHTRDSKFDKTKGVSRAELARDVYLLSFYLVGMNSKDLFLLAPIPEGDRITYNRAKTESRRADQAEISIKIESEARVLLNKYKDPKGVRALDFYLRYSNERIFNSAVNRGLKIIGEKIEVEKLEFYSARHSWATIARNDCDISKDDISQALNHTDPDKRITDKYIKKDWHRIDDANSKVLKYLNLHNE